jgi:hypothetical protein
VFDSSNSQLICQTVLRLFSQSEESVRVESHSQLMLFLTVLSKESNLSIVEQISKELKPSGTENLTAQAIKFIGSKLDQGSMI